MAVVENYPQLKSDQNFRDLQAQLEGTENRIAVARNRYIQAVQNYNVTVRSFPANLTAMMFGSRAARVSTSLRACSSLRQPRNGARRPRPP